MSALKQLLKKSSIINRLNRSIETCLRPDQLTECITYVKLYLLFTIYSSHWLIPLWEYGAMLHRHTSADTYMAMWCHAAKTHFG